MSLHGLKTVSSSRFGSENDQGLFLIMREEDIPGYAVSYTCQAHLG
jgi:hypothetical protein